MFFKGKKTSPLKETGCNRGRDIWERPGKPLSERLVRKGVAVKMTRRIPHASTIAQFGAHVDVGNHVQGEKLHYLELQSRLLPLPSPSAMTKGESGQRVRHPRLLLILRLTSLAPLLFSLRHFD